MPIKPNPHTLDGWKGSNNQTEPSTANPPTSTEKTYSDGILGSVPPDQQHPYDEREVKAACGFDPDDPNVKVAFRSSGPLDGLIDLLNVANESIVKQVRTQLADDPSETSDDSGDEVDEDAEVDFVDYTDPKVWDGITHAITEEVRYAVNKFEPFNSPHEGYAIIKEELDELWDVIKANRGGSEHARKEAIQVAAMAVRYLLDIEFE